MTTINEASGLHQQAASVHEAAAKHHKNAMQSHDSNNLPEAQDHAKKALDTCHAARRKSETACACSSK